jgi:Putative bacterial sensory transduction regulator
MVLQTASSDDVTVQMAEAEATSNLIEVIETVIDSLDSDNTAMVNRSESGHLWKFKYGTVEVFVQLTGLADEDSLTVWASVLKLPAKDEATLTRHLLERNWQNTLEARFGIFNDEVVILTTRSLADLSPGEISRAITIVATIADESDELLQEQFGA